MPALADSVGSTSEDGESVRAACVCAATQVASDGELALLCLLPDCPPAGAALVALAAAWPAKAAARKGPNVAGAGAPGCDLDLLPDRGAGEA